MAAMSEGEGALERRRRRLRYQSWHRGTREADLILGRFADAHLQGLTTGELDRYASLLESPDPDIYGWVTGTVPVPPAHDHEILALLRRFSLSVPRA
jgi:antitoxin CptB